MFFSSVKISELNIIKEKQKHFQQDRHDDMFHNGDKSGLSFFSTGLVTGGAALAPWLIAIICIIILLLLIILIVCILKSQKGGKYNGEY